MNQPLCLALSIPAILLTTALCLAQVSENLLKNPSFDEGLDAKGVPVGWTLYGGKGKDQRFELAAGVEGKAVLMTDGDPTAEIGVTQTVPATGGLTYEASVKVLAVEGASWAGSYLQLRFLPSGLYAQKDLAASSTKEFDEIALRLTAPADTRSVAIYLYTHRDPTPKVILDSVRLVSGVEPPPPPPPPVDKLVPPVYTKLKELHLTTALVKAGKPSVAIVTPAAYQAHASRIQAAIEKLT
ncbi:MAG: hypothetical protein FJ279_31230, partial [Planctomycetes bacterium]|nr:hypothetical protein [Planctomycetota bacterium]